MSEEKKVRCPYCAETINAEAAICRFCQANLVTRRTLAQQIADAGGPVISMPPNPSPAAVPPVYSQPQPRVVVKRAVPVPPVYPLSQVRVKVRKPIFVGANPSPSVKVRPRLAAQPNPVLPRVVARVTSVSRRMRALPPALPPNPVDRSDLLLLACFALLVVLGVLFVAAVAYSYMHR